LVIARRMPTSHERQNANLDARCCRAQLEQVFELVTENCLATDLGAERRLHHDDAQHQWMLAGEPILAFHA
jgi:hypothetical protein